MENFTILRDVSESLRAFLRQNIPELSEEDSIIFDSPAELKTANTTKLSFFLYHIVENSYLRNAEQEFTESNQMKNPPLIIDLFYLITPFAQTRETEYIILERIMRLFHDVCVLKGPMLQGSLEASGNHEIRIVSNPIPLEELNRLWERFHDKPFKLSVSYLLSPVRIPSEIKRDISIVKKRYVDVHTINRGR